MKKPDKIIYQSNEVNDFIKSIEPELVKISRAHHPSLVDIENVKIYETGITFTASGYCYGYFEKNFEAKWEELN